MSSSFIRSVVIYKGHENHPLGPGFFGPYVENVTKQIDMFHILNGYREKKRRSPWEITAIAGEKLIEVLQTKSVKETLLVIPAGQSSHLDAAFSLEQIAFIREKFLEQGGRLYATCGASYMLSALREYNGFTTQNPDKTEMWRKPSIFPLFDGIAKGPLCPFPGEKYRVGFYSDAVKVTNGIEDCTIYLSGGGAFCMRKTAQKVKVLVRYLDEELYHSRKITGHFCEPHNSSSLEDRSSAILRQYGLPHDLPNLNHSEAT